MNDIAIVVTAYNRPNALKLLLGSLRNLRTNREIPLIISIDNGGVQEVNDIANNYVWRYGKKDVIIHNEKKGLVKHFIWTGDQTKQFETVIFLEDDLLVSPEIVNYVLQLSEFYKDDNSIAGASLYNPIINEITGGRFYQLEDGYDNYFFQQPYWGHVWFKKSWDEFKSFLKTYVENSAYLPSGVVNWKGSFKKIFIQFLNEKRKFIVTPRVSLVTNNGIAGTHAGGREFCFQSSICLETKKYNFSHIEESHSIYDSSYEIFPNILKYYNPELLEYEFEVDVNGSKRIYKAPYVLTTKPVKSFIKCYSSLMKPTELSVVLNQEGNGELKLCSVDAIIEKHSFYRKRRFNDVLKNFPMGIYTSIYSFLYLFKRILALCNNFLKKI